MNANLLHELEVQWLQNVIRPILELVLLIDRELERVRAIRSSDRPVVRCALRDPREPLPHRPYS